MFSKIKRKRYYAVFLQLENNRLEIQKKKRIHVVDRVIQFKKGNSHIVDWNNPMFADGLDTYYFFDVDKGQLFKKGENDANKKLAKTYKGQMGIEKATPSYNPALIDAIMKQNIVGQLTMSFTKKAFTGMFNMIMYIALGVAVGFIARGFFA